MPNYITDLRDLVLAKILVKKAALEFINNDFNAAVAYLPYSDIASARTLNPDGKVYVVGGVPGDILNAARTNKAIVREYSVIVGYQICDVKVTDVATLDDYLLLVQQLDDMCRTEIDSGTSYSFSRLEYLKDENGTPLSFLGLRDNKTFEAYFTATFNLTLQ